jgi:hypothetical protein
MRKSHTYPRRRGARQLEAHGGLWDRPRHPALQADAVPKDSVNLMALQSEGRTRFWGAFGAHGSRYAKFKALPPVLFTVGNVRQL